MGIPLNFLQNKHVSYSIIEFLELQAWKKISSILYKILLYWICTTLNEDSFITKYYFYCKGIIIHKKIDEIKNTINFFNQISNYFLSVFHFFFLFVKLVLNMSNWFIFMYFYNFYVWNIKKRDECRRKASFGYIVSV